MALRAPVTTDVKEFTPVKKNSLTIRSVTFAAVAGLSLGIAAPARSLLRRKVRPPSTSLPATPRW
ncbi:hypothetical protein L2137_10845 [Corynebacterium diphtheriae bv. mitis]|uniref:hypothetical protein n=1 Tax=Corynebacterium diphtheriae TaxID=1717 RepID=UPI00202BBA5B|nr:hypothetical protein [Corynebacterium diphtheriae]MCM0170316.1 hypothetical protein [Corynebacterium diphtheriae bv. mitis]